MVKKTKQKGRCEKLKGHMFDIISHGQTELFTKSLKAFTHAMTELFPKNAPNVQYTIRNLKQPDIAKPEEPPFKASMISEPPRRRQIGESPHPKQRRPQLSH